MQKFNRLGIRQLTEQDLGQYDVPKENRNDNRQRYPTLNEAFKPVINAYRGKEE